MSPGPASVQPFGTCPHCGARIELPAGSQRCAACRGSYLAIVPEEHALGTSAEGSSEWTLLPLGSRRGRAARRVAGGGALDPGAAEGGGAPHGGPELTLVPLGSALGGALTSVRGWVDARALRGPLRALAVLAAIGIGGLFSAVALHLLLDPGPLARPILEHLLLFFLVMIALPAIALLAALVVLVLLRRRRASEPRVFWRSVIAVTAGVATCWAAVLLLSVAIAAAPAASWRWLEPHGTAIPALLAGLFAWVLAGWLTARLAPGAPLRHALGVALMLALPFVPGLFVGPEITLAVLLAQASVLCLGAWLGMRSRPPIGTPAAAA